MMKTIYNESLGNQELIYTAFCEKDEYSDINVYGILVRDNISNSETVIHSFTSKKEQAIDFIETLIRNIVHPDFVNDIAEDYLISC